MNQYSQHLTAIIAALQDIIVYTTDSNTVMALVAERTQHLTHASGAMIELLEGDELVCHATSGQSTCCMGLRLAIVTSLSGQCIETGEPLWSQDVETDPRVDLEPCWRIGVRSMGVAPILHPRKRIGVLKIVSVVPNAFTPEDIQTLQLMASFLTANLRLVSELAGKTALLDALQESEDRYRSMISGLAEGVILRQADGKITNCNSSAKQILGLTTDQIMGRAPIDQQWQTIHEDRTPFAADQHPAMVTLRSGRPQFNVVMGICKPDNTLTWISINTQPLFPPDGSQPYAVVTSFTDITIYKQVETALRQQAEQERMVYTIAQHIRQSLDLSTILQTTVTEVQHFLQADRVLIYRFNSDWSGIVVTESVAPGWLPVLNMEIKDTFFLRNQGQTYRDQPIQITESIYTSGLSQCHIAFLERLQVQAKLVVPIWQGDNLWGLLVAHQCRAPRQWHPYEGELLLQLATQVAIAIQQAELHRQLQCFNGDLERQITTRTAELQLAYDFEATLKRITDKVRDSLDEQQILQTVVQELGMALEVDCCDTGIYNTDHTISTIQYEYIRDLPSSQGITTSIDHSPNPALYKQLFQGHCGQFCFIGLNQLRPQFSRKTILSCPVFDDQGVLGDLWLFKSPNHIFDDSHIRLVQQVANQCAIALRQSRLYRAAQAQVEELARLNQLKDDFLSTVSHELRTPIASIKMALQMLDICLQPLGVFEQESIHHYFQILQTECNREMSLINDLLDLARLNADIEPLHLSPLQFNFWLPHIAESFTDRMECQHQTFEIRLSDALPIIITDLSYLKRILTELLHNACKYTPAGEKITVSVECTTHPPTSVVIHVSNSGVEIAPEECDRIFDKFYRIPNNDPWKYGGTGLGLALVRRLVERLGGIIQVASMNGQTTFTLELPINCESDPQLN